MFLCCYNSSESLFLKWNWSPIWPFLLQEPSQHITFIRIGLYIYDLSIKHFCYLKNQKQIPVDLHWSQNQDKFKSVTRVKVLPIVNTLSAWSGQFVSYFWKIIICHEKQTSNGIKRISIDYRMRVKHNAKFVEGKKNFSS